MGSTGYVVGLYLSNYICYSNINTSDCNQSNVAYTPRALFSGLFVKICLFVLSLYTVGRL